MSNEDIIRMAREAGIDFRFDDGSLEHFFQLAYNAGAAAEREACAKVCENMERNGDWITKVEAASAIRARGNT